MAGIIALLQCCYSWHSTCTPTGPLLQRIQAPLPSSREPCCLSSQQWELRVSQLVDHLHTQAATAWCLQLNDLYIPRGGHSSCPWACSKTWKMHKIAPTTKYIVQFFFQTFLLRSLSLAAFMVVSRHIPHRQTINCRGNWCWLSNVYAICMNQLSMGVARK